MTASAFDNKGAGYTELRVRDDFIWFCLLDICKLQGLSRKIEPPDASVFIDIAQYICKLKRVAEMVRERFAVSIVHAEDAHGEPADRAGNPVAIQLELVEPWRLNIRSRIHFHAINNRQ